LKIISYTSNKKKLMNTKINWRLRITNVIMCSIICCIALFFYSNRFVNVEVTPKWLAMMLAVGLMGMRLLLEVQETETSDVPVGDCQSRASEEPENNTTKLRQGATALPP